MIAANATVATKATRSPYSIRSSPRSSLPIRFRAWSMSLLPSLPVAGARSGLAAAPHVGAAPAGRVLRLRLVQSVSRTLIGIRDRRHQTQRVRDDHSQGDRGDERDQKAVLHEILTPLVPDELLRELEHLMKPSLKLVIDSPFRDQRSLRPNTERQPKTMGRSGSLESRHRAGWIDPPQVSSGKR